MAVIDTAQPVLQTLPGDEVRQILWRFQDRFDLQILVQGVRGVARGPVARLVAQGGRNTHEWTPAKAELLVHLDAAGVSRAFLPPEHGGLLEGPRNLALSLIAFELAWVDAGAATSSLAGCLGLGPILERGTKEQQERYLARATPGDDGRPPLRAAFALTEPLPYVGVETGLLSGRATIAAWDEGQEPVLEIRKRGRFVTNMGFADIVTAAVDSGDPRLKGSCMVILEADDPGTFERGTPTRKLVHQLSSTSDPVFELRVPARRIVGGYTVQDGVLVPHFSHAEIIEAVFRKSRVTVGAMTAAKLLSAVEPLIRYHRERFRGAEAVVPGSPRHDAGLQQREDCLHRLLDVWATGEAAASLGFAAARCFDELEPLEQERDRVLAKEVAAGGSAVFRALRKLAKPAVEYLETAALPADRRDPARFGQLEGNPLIRYLVAESVANVLCPACKLWNTGVGATMMREAVALMGGYGITEDCPGYLPHKWMDAQLEATYEGPESVQRRQLTLTMNTEVFVTQVRCWTRELEALATEVQDSGAGTLAAALELWTWTLKTLEGGKDPAGNPLYTSNRRGVTFPMADALCWLLASRALLLDVRVLAERGPESPVLAEALPGLVGFYTDLCVLQAARAAGEAGRICTQLLHGCRALPGDSEALKIFEALRLRVDRSLAGSHLAKDRATLSLAKVMIPTVLDYPA